jgi:hypothetical protein
VIGRVPPDAAPRARVTETKDLGTRQLVPSGGTVFAEISDRLAAGRGAALLDQHGRRASSASVLSAFWHKYELSRRRRALE